MKLAKVTITEPYALHQAQYMSTTGSPYAPQPAPLMSFFCPYTTLGDKLATVLNGLLQSRGSKSFNVSVVDETIPDEYIAPEFRT